MLRSELFQNNCLVDIIDSQWWSIQTDSLFLNGILLIATFMYNHRKLAITRQPLGVKCVSKAEEKQPKQQQRTQTANSQSLKHQLQKESQSKQEYNLKKAFLLFSLVHHKLHLKTRTLFLAYGLYSKYIENNPGKTIPEIYLTLISLHLALKFEQIYPPSIKSIASSFKVQNFDIRTYTKYEVQFLSQIDCQLNITTHWDLIKNLIKNPVKYKEIEYSASYFLELAISNQKILKKYTFEEICKTIVYMLSSFRTSMRRLDDFQGISLSIICDCMREMILLRIRATDVESKIFKKYASGEYNKTAIDLCLQTIE